ncbi:MAG: hypothetical protein MZW92_13800 [Comamonadaceae bacterium]|nr:hypothetical protein [Comamonadaceae bacterium]
MNRIAGLRCERDVAGALIAGAAPQAQTAVGAHGGRSERRGHGVGPLRRSRCALPPGTNGLAPALAITYDSRSGNGLLGVGFRLDRALDDPALRQHAGRRTARLAAVALDAVRSLLPRRPAAAPDGRHLRPAGFAVPDRGRDALRA